MKKFYVDYYTKKVTAEFAVNFIWGAIPAYIVLSQKAVGVENINIFQLFMVVISLISIKIAYETARLKLKNIILFTNIIYLIFTLILLYSAIIENLFISGISVYSFMIVNSLIGTIIGERRRQIEKKYISDKNIRHINKKLASSKMLGNLSGIILAILIINIFKIDILIVVRYLLLADILVKIYEIYLWFRYIRHVNYRYENE